MLTMTRFGLYCPEGDFYIDPQRSVDRAIITHAHSDHARPGMRSYLCSKPGEQVLKIRVGSKANIQGLDYGEVVTVNGVKVSLHPAGHILGSAQVRIEQSGEIAVVSGDYKVEPDATCAEFELVRCHHFITESTFGLPIFRWKSQLEVFQDVNRWCAENQAKRVTTILTGYSLGKAQRILAGLDASIGPIVIHPSLISYTQAYRAEGVVLPHTVAAHEVPTEFDWSQAVLIAPPGDFRSDWRSLPSVSASAFLSGWMAIRNTRRGAQNGFVLSDHVDWDALIATVLGTRAERVWVTHGYSAQVARYLSELGIDAVVHPRSDKGGVREVFSEEDTA